MDMRVDTEISNIYGVRLSLQLFTIAMKNMQSDMSQI